MRTHKPIWFKHFISEYFIGVCNVYGTNEIWSEQNITKRRLYNFDPLKHHFYIVKLGFTGVYIIFFILQKNIDCGYSLESPRRGGSNEYPQSMFSAEIRKIYFFFFFLSEIFQFLVVKFSIHLNRRVFVMNMATYLVALLNNRSCTNSEENMSDNMALSLRMRIQDTELKEKRQTHIPGA